MATVAVRLDFLAKSSLYKTEKPYLLLPSPEQNLDPDVDRLSNLEFEAHDGIVVENMRSTSPKLDVFGFEYLQHTFAVDHFDQESHIEDYRAETQQMLRERFGAEKVVTYDIGLRKNQDYARKSFDVNDPLLVEGPAKGAHTGEHKSRPGTPRSFARCHL
jgi:hypothetical protein